MGLARELSMGPRKPRSRVGNEGDFAALRRMTKAENPNLDTFRAILDRVGAQKTRFRFAEGAAYISACTRYSQLTGEPYGVQQGILD